MRFFKLVLRTLIPILIVVVVILIGIAFRNGRLVLPENISFSMKLKPGTCLLLEERFCRSGKFVYLETVKDPILGFNIPVGTPVFAPIDGKMMLLFFDNPNNTDTPYFGASVNHFVSPNSTVGLVSVDIIGNPLTGINQNFEVKKGDILGYVSETPVEAFGNYNLIVNIKNQGLFPGTVYSNTNLYIKDKLRL